MAKFVFELDAVLKARQAEERQKQLAVAGLERERALLEDHIRECQRGIVTARDDLRGALGAVGGGAAVDLRTVRMQAGASLHLVARAQRAVLELAGLHRRIDNARVELLRAAVRRKAVESLRERRYEAWREAQRSKENAALDELMVIRSGRQEDDA